MRTIERRPKVPIFTVHAVFDQDLPGGEEPRISHYELRHGSRTLETGLWEAAVGDKVIQIISDAFIRGYNEYAVGQGFDFQLTSERECYAQIKKFRPIPKDALMSVTSCEVLSLYCDWSLNYGDECDAVVTGLIIVDTIYREKYYLDDIESNDLRVIKRAITEVVQVWYKRSCRPKYIAKAATRRKKTYRHLELKIQDGMLLN